MLSADQVPVKSPHSLMQWHLWVVLIAGSSALHYVLFALPTFTSRLLFGREAVADKITGRAEDDFIEASRATIPATQTRMVSPARIRLVSRNLCDLSKG
jgi:hypothetical protein